MYEKRFKVPIIKIIIILILIILSFNIYLNYVKIELPYKYSSDQIETIFFIHRNVPENSEIFVPDISDKNYIYELLIGYKYRIYDSKHEHLYQYIKNKLIKLNIQYLIIDLSKISKIQLDFFKSDEKFIILFENEINIVVKYLA